MERYPESRLLYAIREIEPDDCAPIRSVAEAWWGGPVESDCLTKWFFRHFGQTCFVAVKEGRIVGFVLGFLSQSLPDEAYIRLVMVDPDCRGMGIARALYEEFIETVRDLGRSAVVCVTAPSKSGSIAFHARLGFRMDAQERMAEGLPVCDDYDGRGGRRVVFRLELKDRV